MQIHVSAVSGGAFLGRLPAGQLLLSMASVLTLISGVADARCRLDGQSCRSNSQCCGSNGRNGVCVRSSARALDGICCTVRAEVCDGLDNDCDAVVDEKLGNLTCGEGDCATNIASCLNGVPQTCDPSASDGRFCDDGDLCTDSDACGAGVCEGEPADCDDESACTTDSCDPSTGDCLNETLNCDDNDLCTVDECDPDSGCTHRAKCDDASLCTTDICNPSTGQCLNFGAGCLDFNPCTSDVCDPATGLCVFTPVVCDDGNACTNDTCNPQTGSCVSVPKECDDGNRCNREICNTQTGLCVPDPFHTNVPCNDGISCTTDSCDPPTGHCIFTPGSCPDDVNACTYDICDPLAGCQYPPVSCDDQNPCTNDTCHPLFGCIRVPKCPNAECRGEACDPASGACGPVFANGTACDDGNECTVADACHEAICVGTPCSETQTCCAGAGCVDLSSNNAHCGACDNACQNSACFQGTCFDGCVIDGVGYLHGARNPNNVCQMCDAVSFSRTNWRPLSGVDYTCHSGCFRGFCENGACAGFGGVVAGCPSDTCATSICHPISQQCVYTPQNEGGACTPPLVNSGCRSSTQGTCQSGLCVALPDNEGEFCIPQTAVPECYSPVEGTCAGSGQCVANRLPDGAACQGPNLCRPGTCGTVGGTFQCSWPGICEVPAGCGGAGTCDPTIGQCTYPGPFPASGENYCGSTDTGYHPERCCPGQDCICNPFSAWCWGFYECWWPDDIP